MSRLAYSILLFALFIPTPAAQAQRTPPSEWKWVDRNIAENCEHGTLYSNASKREIGFSVYLPPSYTVETARRYPVVYYLHGAGGSESSSREFAWAVEKAIKEGVIEETIYVFPNGGHYSGYRDWEDQSVMAETWIIKELIPHIDKSFRTLAVRGKRALCGWSMGGNGSLRFLCKYSDTFCAAATMAAALTMRGGDPNDTAEANLIKNVDRLRGRTAIWMAVGEQDRLKDGNVSFAEQLEKLEVESTLTILPDVGHNLGTLSSKFHRDIVLMLDEQLTREPSNHHTLIVDEAYKSGPQLSQYETERCKLDWYLPIEAKNFPTLVWFHGGGLQNGHKADDIAVALAKRFAEAGVAVASVNYRLSPRAKYPAYLQDAAAAVAHVHATVSNRGGDSKRIFVSGHSAGGYLAAMVGVDSSLLAAHGLMPSSIAGYIPVSGQMITHSTVRGERNIPRSQPVIDEASPAFHATANTSPFLCIAGDRDLPARSEENRYFAAAMSAAGHKEIEFVEFAGRDHATIANQMGKSDDAVAKAILAFIQDKDSGNNE